MHKRLHLLISGRVQGVFFREFIKIKAKELAINGWVKNTEDDGVEVVAEGEEENLKLLLASAKKGPSASRVDDVKVTWEIDKGEFSSFNVK